MTTDSDLGTQVKTNFDQMRRMALDLIDVCEKKDREYGSSWKKRGGVGAFFAVVRKLDRLEEQCRMRGYDMFDCSDDPGSTEELGETIGDAINYLMLVLHTRKQIRAMKEGATRPPGGVDA